MTLKLTYITNIPTHHQVPVGRAFHDLLGENFSQIFMNPVDSERLSMGWRDPSLGCDWVIRTWESEAQKAATQACINDSDVLVYGSIPVDWVRGRILAGKLTFRNSERLFKHGVLLGFPWWFRRLSKDFCRSMFRTIICWRPGLIAPGITVSFAPSIVASGSGGILLKCRG